MFPFQFKHFYCYLANSAGSVFKKAVTCRHNLKTVESVETLITDWNAIRLFFTLTDQLRNYTLFHPKLSAVRKAENVTFRGEKEFSHIMRFKINKMQKNSENNIISEINRVSKTIIWIYFYTKSV